METKTSIVQEGFNVANNDPNDYRVFKDRVEGVLTTLLHSADRFQPITKREDKSVLPLEVVKGETQGKLLTTHKGVFLMKGPHDIALYHQFLWHVKPATIIELGVFHGGSAIWFGDTAKQLGIECRVFAIDIDLSLVSEKVHLVKPDNVTFLEGDCFKIEQVLTREMVSKFAHPIVLIDDAHANSPGVMQYFHSFSKPGDYIIIEDTSFLNPTTNGMGLDLFPELGCQHPQNPAAKMNELRKFMEQNEGKYLVDTFFTDFYGYNATYNWNGFIKRVA